MENMTTRKNFIGALGAALALPVIGLEKKKDKDWFQDIRVDWYYVLQGGEYKDTGGWGCPGSQMGCELIDSFRYYNYCKELEDKAEIIEKKGYYLSPTHYFGKDCKYDKIPLTKKWIMEFYRRHKDDGPDVWQARYDRYFSDYKAGKYSPENTY